MAESSLSITVDGREVEARPEELLIAAAERHGVYIPRFCYHPRMKPVGMCRMCLVDVDTGRGPALQPACMLPVADGMKVETRSERARKAQDGVLEFLLVNHPLDCPVCDKGGECPLQDQTVAFGPGESRFVEQKVTFEKPIPISDLVYLDRERCILCDRCTRFAADVAGDPLISFLERGARTEVNTFPNHPFASYFSGNTVQICPVGALTARPYRFRARPWDLEQAESTCTSCSVGCRVAIQSSRNKVLRYLGVDVDPVNWGWLCDKGRFDFEWVNSEHRLGDPLVKRNGALEPASWGEALSQAADGLRRARDLGGPGAVAVLGGARLTNEDAYAWAKLAKGVLGTDNVDAQLGDGLPAEVVLGLPRATIDEACSAGAVILLGPDLKEELPVLHLRLRDAVVNKGLRVLEVSPRATGLTRHADASVRYRPGAVTQAVRELLDGADLGNGDDVVVVLGRPSLAEASSTIVDAAAVLAERLPGARFLSALRRANVRGALDLGLAPGVLPGRVSLDEGRQWFTGAWGTVPEERGMDAAAILAAGAEGRLQALVLLGADPVADFPDRDLARRALGGAAFVIAVDCFETESSRQADVVLPAAGYAEKPGTTTNLEGRISLLEQEVTPPGTARADWMIAAELAFRLGHDLGVDSVEAVWDEIERLAPAHRGITRALLVSPSGRDGVVAPLTAETVLAGEPGRLAQTEMPAEFAVADAAAPTRPQPVAGSPTPPPPVEEPSATARPGGGLNGGALPQAPEEDGGQADHEAAARPGGGPRSGAHPQAVEREQRDNGAPSLLRFSAPAATELPGEDQYSLRLVAGRRLYDLGTLVQQSPSLAHLAAPAVLHLSVDDLNRLGASDGERLRVRSSRTELVLDAVADPGVPRGSAWVAVNQPGARAADLIDASRPVTDIRVEKLD